MGMVSVLWIKRINLNEGVVMKLTNDKNFNRIDEEGNIIATSDEIWTEGADYILEIIEEANEHKAIVNTPQQMYGAFKWICQNHQYLYINGTIVDGFTASAVWQVINALSEKSRMILLSFSVTKICTVVWKIINKTKQ